MAKFAREIMSKMMKLTRDLIGTMGEDTAELQMRVGLHSGSVTGTEKAYSIFARCLYFFGSPIKSAHVYSITDTLFFVVSFFFI
jgi:class 3 adenylate cyclase